MNETNIICPFCSRLTPIEFQEKHHLIPKSKKGRETILCCCSCGDMIHQIFTIKDLNKKYNSVESIKNNDKFQKWIQWISKKTDFSISMKRKK